MFKISPYDLGQDGQETSSSWDHVCYVHHGGATDADSPRSDSNSCASTSEGSFLAGAVLRSAVASGSSWQENPLGKGHSMSSLGWASVHKSWVLGWKLSPGFWGVESTTTVSGIVSVLPAQNFPLLWDRHMAPHVRACACKWLVLKMGDAWK